MSMQDESGIPLSILSEEQHQHFRLLELPPELLAILTAKQPEALHLKSTQGAPGEPGGTLVLCTPDRTYNVRQKNSSNTVYLLQPSNEISNDDNPRDLGLQAISKPDSTLEISPAAKTAAASYARQLLPVLASTGQTASARDTLTRKQLFSDIPASDGECDAALRELVVFEDETTGHCILPSAQLKMQVWLAMLETARAEGIDLLRPLDRGEVRVLLESSEDLPAALPQAVLHAVASHAGDCGETTIDQGRLVRWTGINTLEIDATKLGVPFSSFRQTWKNALPEQWRDKVDVATIADRHTFSEGGKSIQFRDYAFDFEAGVDGTGAAESKSALGTKRKWHEKFRPSKKS